MFRTIVICALVLVIADTALGDETSDEDKLVSGMSIVGNDEAPKSLVIVPWKSSALGDTLDVIHHPFWFLKDIGIDALMDVTCLLSTVIVGRRKGIVDVPAAIRDRRNKGTGNLEFPANPSQVVFHPMRQVSGVHQSHRFIKLQITLSIAD